MKALEEELREVFSSQEGLLYDMLRYHLGWTDQRGMPQDNPAALHFPPILALASCEALCGDFHAALPAAAGIELVHRFTLVHGDIQSGSPGAQERPTIWGVWGPTQAINAGDGLHALGRTTMMRLAQRAVPADRVLRAVESLDRACLALCEGQYLDLELQDQVMVTGAAYHDMIGRKTGALTGCSAESGALAAGADDVRCARFHEMGRLLGMAWQVGRDVADLWGRRRDGMTGSSILDNKISLPLIHAMENAGVAAKRELGAVYLKGVLQPEDVSRVIDILDQAGSRRFAEERAKELAEQAMEALDEALDGVGLPEEGMENLRNLCRWALEGSA